MRLDKIKFGNFNEFLFDREFQRKVEEFAKRERERNEKFENSDMAITFPDPNEP